MRRAGLALLIVCLAGSLMGGTISYDVSNLGGGTYMYTYSASGFPCPCLGETVDIRFDPGVYASISNGQAKPATDWSLLLFQPDVPLGGFGDYFVTALVSNPSFAGPWTVDFTLKPGQQPSPQQFYIYDANFAELSTGTTVSAIPEPGTVSLAIAGLLITSALAYARRRTDLHDGSR